MEISDDALPTQKEVRNRHGAPRASFPRQAPVASGALSRVCTASSRSRGSVVSGGCHGPDEMLQRDGDSSPRLPLELRPLQGELSGIMWREAAPRTHAAWLRCTY